MIRGDVACPEQAGVNVTDPCLEGAIPEFDGGIPCANPADFLFWDLIHATTKGHAILAERALLAVSALTVP